jgi:microsomal dipeptidase-like Zn-dependent dipeptidase
MTLPRRDFLKGTALAGAGASLGVDPTRGSPTKTDPGKTRHSLQAIHGKATHSVLDQDHPYIYIDSCMQMWPDADFHLAHRHGVTTYAVTAWDPHATPASAMEGILYWHWVARTYPNLPVVRTVEDIREAKRQGKAGLLLAAQDGDWIGLELHRIQAFHEMGLRMMLLAYNATNQLADGCLDRTDGAHWS